MVIWFIGVSGSGKSTLGSLLKRQLDQKNVKSFLIDGDDIRKFFNDDLGYSAADRAANIKRIIFGAYVLSCNDVITIVCNISPFQELRDFARVKLKDYNEIYLHKNIHSCIKNDVKGMYKKHSDKSEIIGLNIPFDDPTSCDLKINIDEDTVEKSFDRLHSFLRAKYPSWPI